MTDLLWGIAGGLEKIHSEGLCHTNLHGGNLLIEVFTDAKIADIGLYGPTTGNRPYFNRAHDKQFAYEICCKNLQNRPAATQLNKQLCDSQISNTVALVLLKEKVGINWKRN
ncbi:14030_t:CDS:2 [Gigaspora margarita]|uniref:14030_t:CDS:1 n=1 Tax=Gigaspora margarita TaxID=4874 RepID=A0ABN7UYJ7_GIGMA|nr:14030_t:CDS:2 [Gigaspora margarita]